MRILGVDPGTRVAGYGIVEQEGTRLRFVAADVLRAPKNARIETRLAALAQGLREVLDRYPPATAAVEDVFVRADPRAALAVGQGRGVVLALLGERNIVVHSYAPAAIKRAVSGDGRADKERVAWMVSRILGLARPPAPTDATDALAAAIAHAFAYRTQALARKELGDAQADRPCHRE